MRYLALATDGDGTVLKNSHMLGETAAALERLRAAGMKLILVTGETSQELKEFPHFELFHYAVAENGAVLFDPATGVEELLCESRPERLLTALREAGLRCEPGRVIVCTDTDQQARVDAILEQLQLSWHTTSNRDDLLVLPAGVDKASGLSKLLARIEIPPERVVGIGDADNDRAMLDLCGAGVAVGNAVPPLKNCADIVTDGHTGHGVVELAEWLLSESAG